MIGIEDRSGSPLARLVDLESHDRLWLAVQTLSPMEKAVLGLWLSNSVEGNPNFQKISDCLGCYAGTVAVFLKRAILELRRRGFCFCE